MLSREAEALYWIGRYLERAEATARRFDVQYHSRLESESADSATMPWHALLFSSGDEAAYRQRYGKSSAERLPGGAADPEVGASILTFLILDGENPSSIRACVTAARENARRCREQISSEMWEHLNRVHLELGEQTLESVLHRTPHALLHWVKCSCWLFDGIAERTMIRGEGWQFLRAGRFLERADATARLLDGKSYAMVDAGAAAGAVDLHQWTALLKSVGAFEAYRKTDRAITPAGIVAYVMLDARFPGAIRYSIERVEEALRAACPRDRADEGNEAERCAGRLLASLVHARAPELVPEGLHAYLTGLIQEGAALHDAIVRLFFSHLTWRPWEAEARESEPGHAAPGEWQLLSSAQ
jgi:uncharacterized alpha-E superfamily protein